MKPVKAALRRVTAGGFGAEMAADELKAASFPTDTLSFLTRDTEGSTPGPGVRHGPADDQSEATRAAVAAQPPPLMLGFFVSGLVDL